MLTLLIPGKYNVANVDVYLAPLVEELQWSWQGVPMEDMSKAHPNRLFNLRAILMWTMHNFPWFGPGDVHVRTLNQISLLFRELPTLPSIWKWRSAKMFDYEAVEGECGCRLMGKLCLGCPSKRV
jgi:hypothetical protein